MKLVVTYKETLNSEINTCSGIRKKYEDDSNYVYQDNGELKTIKFVIYVLDNTATKLIENVAYKIFDASVWNNECDIVEMVLRRKLITDYDKYNILIVACEYGYKEIAELLLDYGTCIDSKSSQWAPIQYAVVNKYQDIVEMMISRGANINIPYSNVTSLYQSRGVNYSNLSYRQSPLIDAANYGYRKITKLLLESGADVTITGHKGNTALHFAAANGHTKIISLLLDWGADINAKNDEGHTPFTIARVPNNHLDADRLLIDRGANVE